MLVRRLCERPGCSGPVSASYGIDNVRLVVWLDSSPSPDPALAGSLCRRHADALIVPKGWRIDDRREDIPRLFPAPSIVAVDDAIVDANEHTPASGVRRRVAKQSDSTPSLFDENASTPEVGDAEIATVPEVEVAHAAEARTEAEESETTEVEPVVDADGLEETRAIPWMPRIVNRQTDDTESDEETHVDATPAPGRLLRRAFGDRNVR